jgi:hypothetical protein
LIEEVLASYALWLESSGKRVLYPKGGWHREGEASRALEIHRQLVETLAIGCIDDVGAGR